MREKLTLGNDLLDKKEKYVVFEDRQEGIMVSVDLSKRDLGMLNEIVNKLREVKELGNSHIAFHTVDYVTDYSLNADAEKEPVLLEIPVASNGIPNNIIYSKADTNAEGNDREYGAFYQSKPIDYFVRRIENKSAFVDPELKSYGEVSINVDDISSINKSLSTLIETLKMNNQNEINKGKDTPELEHHLTTDDISLLKQLFNSGSLRQLKEDNEFTNKFSFLDEITEDKRINNALREYKDTPDYHDMLNLYMADITINELSVRLKAGLYLEDIGKLEKGETIKELTEEGWKKDFLIESKNKMNLNSPIEGKGLSTSVSNLTDNEAVKMKYIAENGRIDIDVDKNFMQKFGFDKVINNDMDRSLANYHLNSYKIYINNSLENLNTQDRISMKDTLKIKYLAFGADPNYFASLDGGAKGFFEEKGMKNDFNNMFQIEQTGFDVAGRSFENADFYKNNIQMKATQLFMKNNQPRISDIHIYSLKGGGMAIRCKIDGEQQSGKRLSKDDLINLTDKTDRKELAMKYFREEMKEQITNTNSLRR